jgi:hypothetical protein
MVFKHKDPGTELTQAEFIAACGDGHIFACQATGDIVYASSATVLSKLAKGSAGTVLSMGCSCIPAWTTNAASATLAATVTVIDSTDTSSFVALFDSATGDLAAKTDAGLAYNSGTGTLTATAFAGPITGNVTGDASGSALTVTQAAQGAITSLGTLTGLTLSGDATLTGAATDVDLIDNNACAISFDAAGQAGILAIDTQNCAEGVKMSGKLTVTGAISTTGAVTVGVDDTGHDVKFFGAAAGAFMIYDQSCDQLEIRGASADATTSTGKLLLSTSLTNVNANDVIGSINFQAPVEAGGTDAIAIAAGIRAVAQATFTCAVNATDLIFYTGHSEAAAERFRFTSQNEIGIAGANYGTDGQVLTSGGANAAVAWEDAAGGCVVCDTSPQLGGNLDMQARLLVGGGGSTGIAIDVNGIVTMAAQPAFTYANAGVDGCVTGNGTSFVTVDFCQKIVDQNCDFACDTFTAPVAGKYFFTANVRIQGFTDQADSEAHIRINTNDHKATALFQPISTGAYMEHTGKVTLLVDMAACNTATVTIRVRGESADTVDVYGDSDLTCIQTYFSGYLVA